MTTAERACHTDDCTHLATTSSPDSPTIYDCRCPLWRVGSKQSRHSRQLLSRGLSIRRGSPTPHWRPSRCGVDFARHDPTRVPSPRGRTSRQRRGSKRVGSAGRNVSASTIDASVALEMSSIARLAVDVGTDASASTAIQPAVVDTSAAAVASTADAVAALRAPLIGLEIRARKYDTTVELLEPPDFAPHTTTCEDNKTIAYDPLGYPVCPVCGEVHRLRSR